MNDEAMQPGRSCPLDYRYPATALAKASELTAECIYVIGGLYGNGAALDAILELADDEPVSPVFIFNGDFNWFNVDTAGFSTINSRVLAHTALRGNVETELARDEDAAGCGCGYPDFVDDADVARSNAIMARLRETARGFPALRESLAALPMFAAANVGDRRIAIVHGDCESLAGWGLSREALAHARNRTTVAGWFDAANADVIASSHSCLPLMREFATPRGSGIVVNNGAAGMPNFTGSQFGVITRIGVTPARETAVYGARIGKIYVDALAVRYEACNWDEQFAANWPNGSPAYISYYKRIAHGPSYTIGEAWQLAEINPRLRRPRAA